ncbi:hypothetical protein H2203_001068 [Taxawa tesnikishii (nom. ined.)]|nr:hypothetical protein H2203_001068 [Dothideales sp. JES 119]
MPELFKRLSGRRAQVEVQLESAKGDDKERLLKLWKTIKRDKSIVAHTARVIQQVSAIRDLHYLSEAPLYEQEAFRRMRQVRTGFAKVLKKATSFDARLLEKEDEYYNTQKAFSTLDEAVFRRALVEERMGALAKDEKAIKKFIDDCIVDAYEAIDKVVRGLGGYGSFTHNAVSVNRSPAVSSYFNHSSNKSSGKYRKAPLMPRNPTIQKHSSRSVSPLSSEASHKPTSRERRLARWKFARAEASPTPPPDDVNSGGTHQGTVGFKPTAPMRQAITAQACEVGAPEDPASDQMSSSNISELATESELEEKREEDVVHLTYQIPPDDLKRALVSSKSSRAAYWKYTLYKGPNGMAPRRFLAHKKDDAEEKAQLFKNEKVLGFDIEWEAYAKLGVSSIKDNVSLVQIACEDKIALFQLAAFQGDAIENLMPPTLRHILESPDIIKAGVNIASDFTRLRQCLDIQGQGIFELSHLYKIVKWSVTEPKKVNKKPCKLADQVEDYLFLPLAKGAVRTSAWSKPLYVEQQEYAANDAYAGFRLFHALEAKRRDMDPTPPRPACYEENKPLVLGNGQEVASRVKAAAKSSGVARAEDQEQQGEASATAAEAEPEVVEELVDEDNDETEDYVDAVEVQPTSEEADATCGTAIEYPTLAATHSSALDDNLANAASSPAAPLPLLHDSSPDALAARQNPNLPLHLSRNMYAYTLWHDQSLSINQIAALLRDPPLQRTTVASCILEAIKASGNELPFDVERMREVLKCIPPAGHARYNEVLMRLVTM